MVQAINILGDDCFQFSGGFPFRQFFVGGVGLGIQIEHFVAVKADSGVLSRAVSAIRHADVLIIGGTSLTVYPAAGLVQYYRGTKLAV